MSRDEDRVTFDSLVELIGREAAERLSEARGGRGIYIPHVPGPNSPLVVAVGQPAADLLARVHGGANLSVPIGPGKRARIRALRQAGRTIDQIAAAERCTRRHVFYVLAEQREDPPLLALLAVP